MSNSRFSKAVFLFVLVNILVSLASNAQAARNTPTKIDDKKKPDCIVDPDGSVLLPGLGRIMVPISGTASYNPPLGDSTTQPGNDGTFPSPDGGDDGTFPSPAAGGDGGAVPLPDGARN